MMPGDWCQTAARRDADGHQPAKGAVYFAGWFV